VNWLTRLRRGFGYLTLDPSARLRRLREEAEARRPGPPSGPFGPLPPLPDSAYPPGAVPLDCSGIPGWATGERENVSPQTAAAREDGGS
jgi:hypothetical protein